MKNKGFVLMETIVVIVVISIALLTIFSSYNKILSKVKSENKYDTTEYIYMTSYIKNILDDCITNANDIYVVSNTVITEHYSNNSCSIRTKLQNSGIIVEKIYILKNINNFKKTINKATINGVSYTSINNNSLIFDAYMIDYLKKLDVYDDDELIIVEYKRLARKTNYVEKKDTKNISLYERYISSLEW